MKANELRIGNLGKNIHDEIYECHAITRFTQHFKGVDKKEAREENDTLNTFIFPIPLTEEWLEKLGLIQLSSWCGNDGDWYRSFGENTNNSERFSIDVNTHNKEFCFDYEMGGLGEVSVVVKHVHQLQNLYFALTGEELVLKD